MIYKYDHPEYFATWDKPDLKKISGNIVLWGAGKVGGVAAHCLKQRNIEYLAFCDIASDKWGTTFCGHTVISPDDLKRDYPNVVVMISNIFYASTTSWLTDNGFSEVYDCSSLFMEIVFDEYDFWMTKEYAIRNIEQYLAAIFERKLNNMAIHQVFLDITTKCTLRCKNCSVFIPYIARPRNYDENIILEDFNKTLDAIGHVGIVNFLGGEPLLHPGLARMIRKLSNERRIERVSLITNGAVLPSSELVEAIKDEKRFLVRISDYGKLSSKLTKLKKILDENGIKYEVANYTYWDQTSRIGNFNGTEEELTAKFIHCTACNVIKILNRKLCICSTGTALFNLNVFPDNESDYVDLSNPNESKESLRERISRYISRPHRGEYLDACRYCSGNHCTQFEGKVPVAEQTTELLSFPKLY